MKTVNWEDIRNIINRQTNIPEVILDYVANIEILELCATGKSVRAIATSLGLDIEDITSTLKETFNIMGWEKNLEFNPLKIYKKFNGNAWEYLEYLLYRFPDLTNDRIFTTYEVAHRFIFVKERLDEYYGNKNS